MVIRMNYTVSVIIPVYNVEAYLERCLVSVVNQTYRDLEIIIINDGSTDESTKICRAWQKKDSRIVLIEKENEGLGPARNTGIMRATGEYIAFVDSDDWWELNAIEEIMWVAARDQLDIIYMNFFYSETDAISGEPKEREFVQYCLFDGTASVEQIPELLFQPDARMWSKVFRRMLFTDNHIYMPAHPYEDFPIVPLLLLKAKRIGQVHKPLYHYFHKRSGNITGNIENRVYIAQGLEELYQRLKKEGYLEKYGAMFSDYAYRLSKDTIDDIFKDFANETDYQKHAMPLWAVLEKYSGEKICLKDRKVFIVGSKAGKYICKAFLFAEQMIGQSEFYDKEISGSDLKKMAAADYIFLDFLGEDFNMPGRRLIEDKLGNFIMAVKQNGFIGKVVLLKLYYTEKYGVDCDKCRTYEEIDKIRMANNILQKWYRDFEDIYRYEIRAIIGFDEVYNYTYEHTKEGCYPWHYHGKFYNYAGEKIRKEIMGYV